MAQQVPTKDNYTDGFTMLPGGMHGGLRPTLVPRNQFSRGINVSVRGGYAKTRPGWTPVVDLKVAGLTPFQGGGRWRAPTTDYIVSVFNGTVFFYDVTAGSVKSLAGVFSPGKQVFTTQAGPYFIGGDGDHSVAFDIVGGVPAKVYPGSTEDSAKMVPATIMHYCMGRVHYVPTKLGITPDATLSYSRYFISSDILLPGDPVSVLGTSETSTLDGGMARGLPDELGPIRGMVSAQNPGKGLGLGPLYVFARDGLASFDVSGPRESVRDNNGNVLTPGWSDSAIGAILEYGTGTDSPWSLVPSGTDVYFRGRDGIYSIARDTQSAQAGAVDPQPISYEVSRWLDPETQLAGVSGAAADFRIHMTAISDGQDGYLGVLSLDTQISNTMGQALAPAWDGIWTGPRFAKVIEANRRGEPTLYAILTDGTIFRLDDTADTDGGTEIKSQLVTRAMYSDPSQINFYKQLKYVDLWLSDITRNTTVKVYFRPDGYQLWTQMGCERTISVDPANSLPQERRRMRFACRDSMDFPENARRPGINSGTIRHAFTYQIKIVWTGCATVTRMDCAAEQIVEEPPQMANGDPPSNSFAVVPTPEHEADLDFQQLPPGPGLDTGWVRGPTKVGNTTWDTGVGIPSTSWPPAYTRQIFPAGPKGDPGATITLSQTKAGGGGGTSGPTIFGDADRPPNTQRSIITRFSGPKAQELGLYGIASAPGPAEADVILVGRTGGGTLGNPYVTGPFKLSSHTSAAVVADSSGFHIEVPAPVLPIGDADAVAPVNYSIQKRVGSPTTELQFYGIAGNSATNSADTNTRILARSGAASPYSTYVLDLIAGSGVSITRGLGGFTFAATGGAGVTGDADAPIPTQKSINVAAGVVGIHGVATAGTAPVAADEFLMVKPTGNETVRRVLYGTQYQVYQYDGTKMVLDWVRFQ